MPSAVFFAPEGLRGHTLRYLEQEAKAICRLCSVVQTCRNYALKDEQSQGIWGGTTAAERTKHRSSRCSKGGEQRPLA